MQISVEYSVQTEALKLLSTLNFVARGFYTTNNFYVLPEKDPLIPPRQTVLLPRYNYTSRFPSWDNFICQKNNLGEWLFPEEKITELNPIIASWYKPQSTQYLQQLQKTAHEILIPAHEKARHIFSYIAHKNLFIHIFPTEIGSYGSFEYCNFPLHPETDIHLRFHIRIDQDPYVLLELFASALSFGMLKPDTPWKEAESISDFHTKYFFSAIPEKHQGTLDSVRAINTDFMKKSLQYLAEIKAPIGDILYHNNQTGQISFMNNTINREFSPYEEQILKLLLDNANHVVSFEKMADYLYDTQAEIKYSLWGIRKTMQRLRAKLEDIGFPKNNIVSVRGIGFMLRK